MFFIGIFGIETKQKEIRDVQNMICKACGSMTSLRLIKTYNYFHFFFIPLFRWGTRYFLISRCCNAMFEISKELGAELEGGRDVPLGDDDLRPVYGNYGCDYLTCPGCRKPVDESFMYCPYCGTKIK